MYVCNARRNVVHVRTPEVSMTPTLRYAGMGVILRLRLLLSTVRQLMPLPKASLTFALA